MAKKLHLQHVKSAVKNKAPLAADLKFGELAINYNNESPAIYIKDSASGIVEFNPITIDSAMSSSSTNAVQNCVITQTIIDNELVAAAVWNDINDRVTVLEETQVDWEQSDTGATDYIRNKPAVYTTGETYSKDEVDDLLEDIDTPFVFGDGENSAVQKGSNAVVFGDNSVAEGLSVTNAIERGITSSSSTEDILTEWATSEPATDKFTLVTGEAAHAEGNNGLALGGHSHVEGNGSVAGGNSSHAEGTGSKAFGNYSHAEGLETVAEGKQSHAEGKKTWASASSSHAEGEETRASASCSHAEGYNTIASGPYSHAEGFYATASTSDSHAEGQGTMASGTSSHAEGLNSVAGGPTSHVEGEENKSLADCSHVEGYLNTANTDAGCSHVEGKGNTVENKFEHAEGCWNYSNRTTSSYPNAGNTIHSIGVGTNATSGRKNAIEVMQNGDIYVNGLGSYNGRNATASTTKTLQSVINGFESTTNKVTELTSGSTDTQYPSAKAVYDMIAEDEMVIAAAFNDVNGRIAELGESVVRYDTAQTLSSAEQAQARTNIGAEDVSNKVTGMTSASTHTEYPSAKAVYDALQENQSALASSTTWSDLVTARDDEELTPGMQYRITDYVTTTAQEDTRSAGHRFDVIVVADSENKLNENARAALHSGDTYFSSCKLESWELKYSLDNDDTRFAWADTANGKGVIYWMKDEWNNECPYDFKNIQFKRSTEWLYDHNGWCEEVIGEAPEEDTYFYTFSWYNEDSEIEDLTLVGQTLQNDEGAYSGVYGNKIGDCSEYNMSIQTGEEESIRFALSGNVLVSSFAYEDGLFYGCYSNTFGNNCYSNTFGNNCYSNTFGNY